MIETKQSLDDLRGAFHSLSENHHKVIVMRELEGLSYSQIGEQLGMTKPVVESTLFRARRRLTQEYNELVSGRRCDHVMALINAGEPKMLLRLGLRERRQLARHLSHCQPCRRCARMAGVDDSLFQAPGIASKVAALLPFGWLRLRRGRSDSSGSTDGHSFAGVLQPLQSVARFADWVAPASGLGRAAAAATAVVLAGLGGGVVEAVTSHTQPVAAAQIAPAPRPATRGPSVLAAARHQPPAATSSASAPNARIALRLAPGCRPGRRASDVIDERLERPAEPRLLFGRGVNRVHERAEHGRLAEPAVAGDLDPAYGLVGTFRAARRLGPGQGRQDADLGGSVQLPQLPKVGGVQLPSLPKLSLPTLPLPSSSSSQQAPGSSQ